MHLATFLARLRRELPVNVPITQDSFAEGNEILNLTLSNATAGAAVGGQSTAVLTIIDEDSEGGTNPIDDAADFVGQHYHDFLNRQGDSTGLTFWTSQITSCGAVPSCIEVKRINVSAAFFLSTEFQETGLAQKVVSAAQGGYVLGARTSRPHNVQCAFLPILRAVIIVRASRSVRTGRPRSRQSMSSF